MTNAEIVISPLRRRREVLKNYTDECKSDRHNYSIIELNQIEKMLSEFEEIPNKSGIFISHK